MPPTELSANKAAPKIRPSADDRRPSLSVCHCGWYGYRSTSCPHFGVDAGVECGLTLSEKTGRPIFCMKNAPKITLPEHVVPELCKPCQFNKSIADGVKATAKRRGQNMTQGSSSSNNNNNNSAASTGTRSFT